MESNRAPPISKLQMPPDNKFASYRSKMDLSDEPETVSNSQTGRTADGYRAASFGSRADMMQMRIQQTNNDFYN